MPPWTGRFLALAFLAFGLGFAAGHFAGAAWGAAAALAPVLAVLAFHLRERERLKRRLADPDGALSGSSSPTRKQRAESPDKEDTPSKP